jgi:two-component system NtrC family response regulator
VRDLESTNGTKIDNTRIREAMVHAGSVLKVGEVDIQFKPTAHRVEVLPSDKHSFGPAIGQSLGMRTIFGSMSKSEGKSFRGFTEDAQNAIDAYPWPGNVREMENRIKAAVIMAEGKFVTAEDLNIVAAVDAPVLNLRAVRQKAETDAINQALIRCGGNISKAAELLGITRPTLYDLMQKNGIDPQLAQDTA